MVFWWWSTIALKMFCYVFTWFGKIFFFKFFKFLNPVFHFFPSKHACICCCGSLKYFQQKKILHIFNFIHSIDYNIRFRNFETKKMNGIKWNENINKHSFFLSMSGMNEMKETFFLSEKYKLSFGYLWTNESCCCCFFSPSCMFRYGLPFSFRLFSFHMKITSFYWNFWRYFFLLFHFFSGQTNTALIENGGVENKVIKTWWPIWPMVSSFSSNGMKWKNVNEHSIPCSFMAFLVVVVYHRLRRRLYDKINDLNDPQTLKHTWNVLGFFSF